jgi:hypothetical protein
MSNYAIPQKDVEANLDGYGKPESKPEPEPEHGLIPKEFRPLVWTSMVTFLMAFLADFAARAAYGTYQGYVDGTWTAPICWDFKLLFYCNMIMGVVYGLVSLMCLIPGVDKMFYSLYWDPKTFPAPKTNGLAFIRQMATVLFAVSLSQVLAPSNTGVGIVVLCINVMITWNFILLSCFNYYDGVQYFKMAGVYIRLADFYFVASIVFVALFSVGLERTNVFYLPWKNDTQNQQTWLFYLNCVCGIMYMIVGIINFIPSYDTWFMSFYFEDLPRPHSPLSFFTRNASCMVIGIAAASLIAPTNPGVGIVAFWIHALLIIFFVVSLSGLHGKIKNPMLWVGWLFSAFLFTLLYAYALNRLDDCDTDDLTCGGYRDWTEQPWDTYKGLGNASWAGCTMKVGAKVGGARVPWMGWYDEN